MPIILVLGLFAGFYLMSLLLRFTVHALPIYVSLTLGFALRAQGAGLVSAILLGLLAGAITIGLGRIAFDRARSSGLRFLIAALFVIPAGFAGYHAVHGIGGLALEAGSLLNAVSGIGACVIATMAWAQLGTTATQPLARRGQLQSGSAS